MAGRTRTVTSGRVLGPTEVHPDGAGDAGEVLEPRHLIGKADRLDDVQPGPGSRHRGADLIPVVRQQGAGGDPLARPDDLLVRSHHAGGDEGHGHRRTATGKAVEQSSQRLQRAPGSAGHLVGGFTRRGLPDYAGE
jgi:hypothetical protein